LRARDQPRPDRARLDRTRSDRPQDPPKPKPVTASYLRASALHYLSARSASRDMLRQVLERRAKRRLQTTSLASETLVMIGVALDGLVELGLLDDQRFAEGRMATLQRRGFSKRRIEMGLKQKGLDAATIRGALGDGIDEAAQAQRFAERRRLGPYRGDPITAVAHGQKDLRALMRAGFSYEVAKMALAGPQDIG
jgi:regulatory protein